VIRRLSYPTRELQQPPKSAKDKSGIEVEAQRIIEQAQAEQKRWPDAAIHPEPDTRAELGAIAAEANHLHEVLTELRERNVPLTTTEAEAAIGGLQEITARSFATARQLGLHAVERGVISQIRLSRMLKVSQMTINRWYHHGLDNPREKDGPSTRNV
jgi:hypothetical protein